MSNRATAAALAIVYTVTAAAFGIYAYRDWLAGAHWSAAGWLGVLVLAVALPLYRRFVAHFRAIDAAALEPDR
jgi:putative effector of murein hydrolase